MLNLEAIRHRFVPELRAHASAARRRSQDAARQGDARNAQWHHRRARLYTTAADRWEATAARAERAMQGVAR